MSYTTYSREAAGLRSPRSTGRVANHGGRATVHYSASELTPIGRAERRKLTKPKRPGTKWYAIWRRPHRTPEEAERRRRISAVIRDYNRAIKAYRKALRKLGAVDPRVVELEKAVWRSFQAYHQDVKGWSDIGYHVGIFASGNRYLGRHATRVSVTEGAHARGANDTLGVVFVTNGPITYHQQASFDEVVEEYGVRRDLLRGHREVPGNATACPGDIIMARIVRAYRD